MKFEHFGALALCVAAFLCALILVATMLMVFATGIGACR